MAVAWPKTDLAAYVRAYRHKSLRVLETIPEREIAVLIEILETARNESRQVFICGNGGSAATASHMAAGLCKEGSWGRETRFRALSLADNVSWMTALANDTDYASIFVEQLKNHAGVDDVLIAFSGSGNSDNVLRAVEWANKHGLLTVAVTGRPGTKLGRLARHAIFVDSPHMGHVEEAHFLVQHLVTYYFSEMA